MGFKFRADFGRCSALGNHKMINWIKRNWKLDLYGSIAILIRVVGLAILIGLAAIELRPLFYEYNNRNFGTQISIIGNSKVVRPPSVTLCIPWTGSHLDKIAEHFEKVARNQTSKCDLCEPMAKNGWDVWNTIEFPNSTCVLDYRLAISEEIMKKLLNSDDGFDALDISNYRWHRPIIDAVWDFMECVKQLDVHMGISLSSQSNLTTTCGDRNGWCFQNQTADIYLSTPEKANKLFGRLVDIFCEYIEFRDENNTLYDKGVCAATIGTAPSVTFEEQFCFALPDKDRFGSWITSKMQSIYGPKAAVNAVTYSRLLVYSDTDLVSFGTGKALSGYPIYVSDGLEDVVRIGYVVTAVVVERRGIECYQERSPAVCRSHCVIRRIVSECGCVPFTFSNSLPEPATGVPYCNSSSYAVCVIDKAQEMFTCDQKCSSPCEFTSYQWIVTKQGQSVSSVISRPRYTSATSRQVRLIDLQFYPISTTFMEFAVTVKNTPAQFVSQVAAVLSLYLGFSGLTCIGLIIFFGKLLKDWVSSMAVKEERVTVAAVNGTETRTVELVGYQSVQEMGSIIESLKAAIEAQQNALEAYVEASKTRLRTQTPQFTLPSV